MKNKHPNFLILFTDQQRHDTIKACGHQNMITPNLDRLVKEGCYFENAYSPNPVCIPARHNLLTGLPAKHHGYYGNFSHPLNNVLPTLPRILADNGYDTRAIGKMHFKPARRHSGFNKMELMEEIPEFREDDEYAMYLKDVGLENIQSIHGVRNLLYMLPQRSLIPEEHHGSTWVADRSVKYIKDNAGKRPFFLWSSWIAPHPPFDVPDSFADLYNDVDIPETLKSKTKLTPHASKSAIHCDLPKNKEKDYIKRIRQLYYSAISLVDKNIGRILKALEEAGELDNTFIIFSSDHGEMLGDHGCFQKQLPYDSASKIPFLIRYPEKIKKDTTRSDFVDLNDILPTVLDVAGIDYPGPQELPGGSVLRNDKDRSYQYIEHHQGINRWISIRDKEYKYNYYYGGGLEELFDMKNDPSESTNLLEKNPEKFLSQKNKLYNVLMEYEKKWGPENHVNGGVIINLQAPDYSTVKRNGQFPKFHHNLNDKSEKELMNDFDQEVCQVVKNEPLVKLHELDLKSWEQNGASKKIIENIRNKSH